MHNKHLRAENQKTCHRFSEHLPSCLLLFYLEHLGCVINIDGYHLTLKNENVSLSLKFCFVHSSKTTYTSQESRNEPLVERYKKRG